MEKAGIPVVQITSASPIAKMVGSNRIVRGHGIAHVTGNPTLSLEDEKELRLALIGEALKALQSNEKTG